MLATPFPSIVPTSFLSLRYDARLSSNMSFSASFLQNSTRGPR
jgi:hypothetical protein